MEVLAVLQIAFYAIPFFKRQIKIPGTICRNRLTEKNRESQEFTFKEPHSHEGFLCEIKAKAFSSGEYLKSLVDEGISRSVYLL